MWCFDPSRGVIVADALLDDADLGPVWIQRVELQLAQPAEAVNAFWWPPASVWATGVARFEASREKRHTQADEHPFPCDKCRRRFKLASGIAKHKCGQAQHVLFTPESVRSAESASGISGALVGAVL